MWRLLKETVSRWLDDFAPSMGAALSFYTLFSLAPLLVIVIAVAGFVFGREAVQGQVFAQLQGLIGTDSAATIQGLIKSASDPKSGALAVVIGLVVMLVGATTVFAELQSDLDRIWKVPAPPKAGLWALIRGRLMTFGMVLAVAFLLLISLVLSAVLAALEKWWSGWLGHIAWLLQAANFAFSFSMAMLLFATIYKILPRVRIAWSDVWIGSAVTALLFTIGKSAIGLYLGRSGIADAYGAAGSIAVILLWVYYAAQTFLLGAEFTCAYAQIHGSHRPSVQRG